jgi:hypothetical protein
MERFLKTVRLGDPRDFFGKSQRNDTELQHFETYVPKSASPKATAQ